MFYVKFVIFRVGMGAWEVGMTKVDNNDIHLGYDNKQCLPRCELLLLYSTATVKYCYCGTTVKHKQRPMRKLVKLASRK